MPQRNEPMSLGLFLFTNGHHAGGWRHPDAVPVDPMDWSVYRDIALKAEAAKLDLIFIADRLALNNVYGGNFDVSVAYQPASSAEPITLISALSAVTQRIGLAATASTSYNAPFTLSRQFASLDHLSGGRIAWNAVTSTSDGEAQNFGNREHLGREARYDKAEEFIQVVTALWDSWEDDPLVLDKHSGVFADKNKVHYVDHHGEHFDVRGPATIPRTPQGRPVIIRAGQSETFCELAAGNADVIFAAQPTLERAQRFYADIKQRAEAAGRAAHEIKVLPGVMPIIGATEADAQRKQAELLDLVEPRAALAFMSASLNYDLSVHALDEPFPDIAAHIRGSLGRFQDLFRTWREQGLTLAEVGRTYIASRSHLQVIGTAEQVADELQRWFNAHACDGFNVLPPYMPGGLDEFLEQVVPLLQQRGVFRRDYSGSTLRDHLGLKRYS
ncbi:MAG: Nitrilotriacetate monooxygenase component A [Pseudomonas citronellolis]|nr:MAG: Nitrilotriacetate monooxygenase component A [Pseudomonas citronellolis]